MRRIAVLAFAFAPLAVAVVCADAHATGLEAVVPVSDGDVTTLGRLDALTVDVKLGPSTAEITQRRSYTITRLYTGGPARLTFYDSVTGPDGGAQPSITINGLPASGATLAPADADAARRRLTRGFGDPAALRGLGAPLH